MNCLEKKTIKNMKNKIHIVFGNYAKSKLLSSSELNIPIENIIDLNDNLRVGPIYNLNTQKGRIIRDEWFFSNIACASVDPSRSQDIKKIENIKDIAFNKELYIWSGSTALEILSIARLLFELKDFNLNICTADFSKIKLERKDGTFYVPYTINIALPEHVPLIASHFKPLSVQKRNELIHLWEHVVEEGELIRVLEDNVKIESVKENYFDHILKAYCKEEFEKAGRVIGKTLVAINFNADDSTLNWRLKQLVKSKELESEGMLKDIRDYQVKLKTTNKNPSL